MRHDEGTALPVEEEDILVTFLFWNQAQLSKIAPLFDSNRAI
jgi:hypothetical protein